MLRNTRQKGFTLIEALVATALFAVTVVSLITIYLNALNLNRRTDSIRKASENARYITEYLSKEIRNGRVDYYGPTVSPCSTTISASSRTLALVNVDGTHLCFFLGTSGAIVSASGPYLWMYKGGLGPYKLNSDDTTITNLSFYVSPTTNPYTAGSTIEPRITITGNVQSNINPIVFPIQTSISVPAYDIYAP